MNAREITFQIESETEKAVSFRAERIDPATGIRGSQTTVWLPKSQVSLSTKWARGGEVTTAIVPGWLWSRKGLDNLVPVEPLLGG